MKYFSNEPIGRLKIAIDNEMVKFSSTKTFLSLILGTNGQSFKGTELSRCGESINAAFKIKDSWLSLSQQNCNCDSGLPFDELEHECDSELSYCEEEDGSDSELPYYEEEHACDSGLPCYEQEHVCDSELPCCEQEHACDCGLPCCEQEHVCDSGLPYCEQECNCDSDSELPFGEEEDECEIWSPKLWDVYQSDSSDENFFTFSINLGKNINTTKPRFGNIINPKILLKHKETLLKVKDCGVLLE